MNGPSYKHSRTAMTDGQDLTRWSEASASPSLATGLDTDLLPVYLLRFDRPQPKRAYANDITQLFQSDFVTLRMARSISFVELNAYLSTLQESGLKPSTLQRKVSSIRGFYSWLIALGLTVEVCLVVVNLTVSNSNRD